MRDSFVGFTPPQFWLFYECSRKFSNPVIDTEHVAAGEFPRTNYAATDENIRRRALEIRMKSQQPSLLLAETESSILRSIGHSEYFSE